MRRVSIVSSGGSGLLLSLLAARQCSTATSATAANNRDEMVPVASKPTSRAVRRRRRQLRAASLSLQTKHSGLYDSSNEHHAARHNRVLLFSTIAAETAAANAEMGERPFIDDVAPAQEALKKHRESPEYRELHRPALTNAAMGLFGGEPGFEKAHRVWVDPDAPHMKHVYNSTALAKNIRYSRYGYFKRELHLVDVDKLIRHGRMLPTPNRLLSDFLFHKVPLNDASCAAILRYQRTNMQMNSSWNLSYELRVAEEMFELMLMTSIPPVEVGVASHAEMVRIAAVAGDWEKGWNGYRQRAVELEEQQQQQQQQRSSARTNEDEEEEDEPLLVAAALRGAEKTGLNSDFFDAVVMLCEKLNRVEEGVATLAELVGRGIKPLESTLNAMMRLLSIGVEQGFAAEGVRDAVIEGKVQSLEAANISKRLGFDVWSLFDFYSVPRSTESFCAFMQFVAISNEPEAAGEALRLADSTGVLMNESVFTWFVYAHRNVPNCQNLLLDIFAQLQRRGLSLSLPLLTQTFQYTALQQDGDFALSLYQQQFLPSGSVMTPEILLFLAQSFSRSGLVLDRDGHELPNGESPTAYPTTDMVECLLDGIQRLEKVGTSATEMLPSIYHELFLLCGRTGAVATGFSQLKKVLSLGLHPSTQALNWLLLANSIAEAPRGSRAMTVELIEMIRVLGLTPTPSTVANVTACDEAHGATAESLSYAARLLESMETANASSPNTDGTTTTTAADIQMADDEPLPAVTRIAPHRMRTLQTAWALSPRDMALKKFGQYHSIKKKADSAVQVFGTTVPFGHFPGAISV